MEIENKEKYKSNRNVPIFSFSKTNQKKDENEDISKQLKSDKLLYFEINFDEKLKKFFDKEKFKIGDQFDQKGSEKFLSEKDENLKLMDLDYTILYSPKKDSKKHKKKHESKNEKKKLKHDEKYISDIKVIDENEESFISTESAKQFYKEFASKSNGKK